MKGYAHTGIEKVSNFIKQKKSAIITSLFKKGFIYLSSLLEQDNCVDLIRDLNKLRGIYPYHLIDKDNYAGVFRSPFLNSNNYLKVLPHTYSYVKITITQFLYD